MAIFFTVVLGIAGLCVFAVFHQPTEERVRVKYKKSFDRTVAEGMRLWNPKEGVDSIRFDSCRIEKMRMGAFTLGAFNVLCLDGLVLNLPLPEEEEDGERGTGNGERGKKNGAVDVFAAILPRSFLQRAGVPVRSFSGIRIKGLSVNRVENRREMPVFVADVAKNRGRTLELKNCRVFEPGRTNFVGVARLVLQPEPALVWEGGERKLDDLFPKGKDK